MLSGLPSQPVVLKRHRSTAGHGSPHCLVAQAPLYRPVRNLRVRRRLLDQQSLRAVPELLDVATTSAVSTSILPVVYSGLGMTALTFCGTFFLAPQFKSSFKEAVDWKDMYAELERNPIQCISAEEAYTRTQNGAVLVDVRMYSKYADCTAEGAIGVPLYQPIEKWDVPSNIRRLGFAFFGIYGTELNTSFVDEMLTQASKNAEVILICETGGSLQNKPGTHFGFQSRSLKALYFLLQAGFKNVSFVEGGLAAWIRQDLPTVMGQMEEQEGSGNDGLLPGLQPSRR